MAINTLNDSLNIGSGNTASGKYSFAQGRGCTASGDYSHAEGGETIASGVYSHAEGLYTETYNSHEHACGIYNLSTKSDVPSASTLFSVGFGSENIKRMNALEVMRNGDVYIMKDDGTYGRLQDLFK